MVCLITYSFGLQWVIHKRLQDFSLPLNLSLESRPFQPYSPGMEATLPTGTALFGKVYILITSTMEEPMGMECTLLVTPGQAVGTLACVRSQT